MIIHIKGSSNTGKTSLIEELAKRLGGDGMRVGVIKHVASPIEIEGKDSQRFREAGVQPVCLIGEGESAFFLSGEMELERCIDIMRSISDLELDPIIVESFSTRRIGDVELDFDTMELRAGDDTRTIEKGRELDAILEAMGSLKDTIYKNRGRKVSLYVDGKRTPTNRFVTEVISNVVRGIISPLHGCGHIGEPDREITVEIRVDSSK